MNFILTDIECRVLGALVEKDATTPDYYPLSLNSLINACNQKSSRDPVMNLDESVVRQALDSLQGKRLAGPTSTADSRVTKYEHRLQEVFNFTRGESAILCVLLLRGPQTPGELRGRTERAYRFESLDDVQSGLQRLMDREPPFVAVLPRQPGTKEARYIHLLSGYVPTEFPPAPAPPAAAGSDNVDRVARMEQEMEVLKADVEELKRELAEFRKQFD